MNDDDIPGMRPGPAFSNSSMWEHGLFERPQRRVRMLLVTADVEVSM